MWQRGSGTAGPPPKHTACAPPGRLQPHTRLRSLTKQGHHHLPCCRPPPWAVARSHAWARHACAMQPLTCLLDLTSSALINRAMHAAQAGSTGHDLLKPHHSGDTCMHGSCTAGFGHACRPYARMMRAACLHPLTCSSGSVLPFPSPGGPCTHMRRLWLQPLIRYSTRPCLNPPLASGKSIWSSNGGCTNSSLLSFHSEP